MRTPRRLAIILLRNGGVGSAAFSPDGRWVVTASDDRTARVWDAATGSRVGQPLRHVSSVRSAAFSSDGERVVTVSEDSKARVWDVKAGRVASPLVLLHDSLVTSAAFSPDGRWVVTASADRARVWNAQRVLTVSGSTVQVWEAASGRPLGEPLRHNGDVRSAKFSPDGQRVLTASGSAVQVWEAASGRPLGEPLRHKAVVESAEFGPDGQLVVTASRDRSARIWRVGFKGTKEDGPILAALAEAVGGYEVNQLLAVDALADPVANFDSLRNEFVNASENVASVPSFIRWFLSGRSLPARVCPSTDPSREATVPP